MLFHSLLVELGHQTLDTAFRKALKGLEGILSG